MIELSFPGDLTDADDLATQLFATGLSREACQSKADLLVRAASALSVTGRAGSHRPPLAFFVPGRIEVLGKHTDYAGGRTMVAAIERGFCIAALPRDDRQIVIIDAATGETVVFTADPDLKPREGSWPIYPMTVARRWRGTSPAPSGRRYRAGQRLAARRRNEQLERHDRRDIPRAGRGQPVDRSRRVLAQHRQQDRPGRLPQRDRERREFRHVGGRQRRRHVRRQRRSHRDRLRRAERDQPIRLLPG